LHTSLFSFFIQAWCCCKHLATVYGNLRPSFFFGLMIA
jgi:hypothetical protein